MLKLAVLLSENFIQGNSKKKKKRWGVSKKAKYLHPAFCFFEVLSHLWRIDSA
jgi:hypothetical protein